MKRRKRRQHVQSKKRHRTHVSFNFVLRNVLWANDAMMDVLVESITPNDVLVWSLVSRVFREHIARNPYLWRAFMRRIGMCNHNLLLDCSELLYKCYKRDVQFYNAIMGYEMVSVDRERVAMWRLNMPFYHAIAYGNNRYWYRIASHLKLTTTMVYNEEYNYMYKEIDMKAPDLLRGYPHWVQIADKKDTRCYIWDAMCITRYVSSLEIWVIREHPFKHSWPVDMNCTLILGQWEVALRPDTVVLWPRIDYGRARNFAVHFWPGRSAIYNITYQYSAPTIQIKCRGRLITTIPWEFFQTDDQDLRNSVMEAYAHLWTTSRRLKIKYEGVIVPEAYEGTRQLEYKGDSPIVSIIKEVQTFYEDLDIGSDLIVKLT